MRNRNPESKKTVYRLRIKETIIYEQRNVFSSGVYEAVKAEAMALRGFLHFDLLRGFAPSYLRGADKAAIPYVKK